MSDRFKRSSKCRDNSPTYLPLKLIQHIQVPTGSISPGMTTVFHARPYDRFIEIMSNLWSNRLYKTNQDFNFLGGSFSNSTDIDKEPPKEALS